jgi:hypothetical protein
MNKPLPYWYNAYLNHVHNWNSSFIQNDAPMKIQFIPKNNKYTIGDHLNILQFLKESLINYNPNYSITLIHRPEGGFQLHNKDYIKHDSDLQIISNIIRPKYLYLNTPDNRRIELQPYSSAYNTSGIKVFEFTAYKNVPKKVMLYLYGILQNMEMFIHSTENFPDLSDVVWEHKTIWEDKYLYDPKK